MDRAREGTHGPRTTAESVNNRPRTRVVGARRRWTQRDSTPRANSLEHIHNATTSNQRHQHIKTTTKTAVYPPSPPFAAGRPAGSDTKSNGGQVVSSIPRFSPELRLYTYIEGVQYSELVHDEGNGKAGSSLPNNGKRPRRKKNIKG